MSTPISSDSTEYLEKGDLERGIAFFTAELAKRNSAKEKATRDRIFHQQFLGLEQNMKSQEEHAASFPVRIDDAYDKLKTAIADRHREWRGRFHMPESNAQVHRAVSQLTLMMNGHLEALMSLEQVRVKYEDAKRLRDRIAAERKPEQD